MIVKKLLTTVTCHDQIALSAIDIVRSEGIRALSLAAVAEKVGLVSSAIFRHLKNKSDIVGAVLQLIQTNLDRHYQSVIQQRS